MTSDNTPAVNADSKPTIRLQTPKSWSPMPAVPPASNFKYLGIPKFSKTSYVPEKPKQVSDILGVVSRSYASVATPVEINEVATAPADDGSAAVDISAALQVGIPLSVGPVEDGSTAVHVSAVLQRILDVSEKPLDVLIVDGLIKYLFDPSAPPGEGLISAGPPLESNADEDSYSFRLEARSTHRGLDWPDLGRDPACFWDGPLLPLPPPVKEQRPTAPKVNDGLQSNLECPEPALGSRLSELGSTDQAQQITGLMRPSHEAYLEYSVGSHLVLCPSGDLESDGRDVIDQVEVSAVPVPGVTVTAPQDLGLLTPVLMSKKPETEAIVTVNSADPPATEPYLEAELETILQPDETGKFVAEISGVVPSVPFVRGRRGRKGWVKLELGDLY